MEIAGNRRGGVGSVGSLMIIHFHFHSLFRCLIRRLPHRWWCLSLRFLFGSDSIVVCLDLRQTGHGLLIALSASSASFLRSSSSGNGRTHIHLHFLWRVYLCLCAMLDCPLFFELLVEFAEVFVEEDGGTDGAVEGGHPMQVDHTNCRNNQKRNSAE